MAEIIKSMEMNQHSYGQKDSGPWKPIPIVLFPEFYYKIVTNEKAVPDLHYDNLPSIGIYIYICKYLDVNLVFR